LIRIYLKINNSFIKSHGQGGISGLKDTLINTLIKKSEIQGESRVTRVCPATLLIGYIVKI
jgi:hypothetical protein